MYSAYNNQQYSHNINTNNTIIQPLNSNLDQNNNILFKSSWEYREYINKQSNNIQTELLIDSCNKTGYNIPPNNQSIGTFMGPYMFKNINEPNKFQQNSDLFTNSLYTDNKILNKSNKSNTIITPTELSNILKK